MTGRRVTIKQVLIYLLCILVGAIGGIFIGAHIAIKISCASDGITCVPGEGMAMMALWLVTLPVAVILGVIAAYFLQRRLGEKAN